MASLDLAVSVWKCRGLLIQDLLVDDILPYLRQEGVLDQDGEETIKHEITTTRQADKLIEIILRKSLHNDGKAAILFTEALNHSQEHLCRLIQDTDVSSQDTERYLIEQFQKLYISAQPKENERNVFTETSEFLERHLKETYSHEFCYLHPIPWNPNIKLAMKEMFSECTFIDITQQPNHQASVGMSCGNQTSRPQEQTLDHLFDGTEACPDPRRITVEGPMGVGKTTMLHKLAYDWACNRNDELTKRFKYVFYFPQHTLKGTLPQSIIETILPDDANSEYLPLKMMLLLNNQEIQQKTLILVDGFDEKEDGLFHDIWKGMKLRYCTVVQTNQSGFNRDDLSKATEKHCQYLGLSPDGRKSFVEKYVSIMGISAELLKSLEDLPVFLTDLLNIPLSLSFICLLLEEKVSVSPMSQFHLLEEVVNLICMKAAKKLGITLAEVQKEMTPFYKTAYQSILNPDVLQNPISNLLSSLGFLIHKKTKSKLNSKVSTHFTHELFQEYLAMKYLVSLEPEDVFDEMLNFPVVHNMSMYVLMAGCLSKQNPSLLFQFYELLLSQLKKFKFYQDEWDFDWFLYPGHNPGHIVLQCLNESGVVEGIDPVLSDVFPRCFFYNPACRMCFKGLLLAAKAYKLSSDIVINPMIFNGSISDLGRSEPCKGIYGVCLQTGCGEYINKLLVFLILTKFPDLQRLAININWNYSLGEFLIPDTDFSDEIAKKDLNIVALALTVFPCATVPKYICPEFYTYVMNILGSKLQVLGVNGLFIHSNLSSVITNCIDNSPAMKAFIMSNNVTSLQGINDILNALDKCQELRYFNLSANRVTNKAQQELSHVPDHLPQTAYQILKIPSLREVYLGSYSIVAQNLMILSKDLSPLTLDNITWADGVPTHLLGMLKSSQMEEFTFTNIVTNPELASNFHDQITQLRNVTTLNLSFNQIGSSIFFQKICHHLASLQSLSELRMIRCGITDETIHYLEQLMDQGKLTVLWIHGNAIKLENIPRIIKKLKLLKELSITVTKTEFQSMSNVFEFLATSGAFMTLFLYVVANDNGGLILPMLPFNVELFVVKTTQTSTMLDSTWGYKFTREWMCKYQVTNGIS